MCELSKLQLSPSVKPQIQLGDKPERQGSISDLLSEIPLFIAEAKETISNKPDSVLSTFRKFTEPTWKKLCSLCNRDKSEVWSHNSSVQPLPRWFILIMKLDSPSLRPVTYQGCKGGKGSSLLEIAKSIGLEEVE
ncbi:hypothetical protein RCL_jg20598.t1 [Rhizophagus clarus]|uniref:Uncharacterized protein n=1 Tax=Rhizophagus clarus TaxID=94130 RepID=A0A8H3LIE7_9GLOM|nr:hypothetical protein RCL_jg20598.t1 [Rhizophagus clarus]